MNDKPIIMSGASVKAILAGQKTMTRRILKPQPELFSTHEGKPCDVGLLHIKGDEYPSITLGRVIPGPVVRYAVGQRLWVREAWQIPALCDIQYRATSTERIGHWNPTKGPWRSPIHMRREFSRLTLLVNEVRVERLHSISEEDAVAEGCPGRLGPNPDFPDEWDPTPVEEFRELWGRLHGPDAWSANPWVAVIGFTPIASNIDALVNSSFEKMVDQAELQNARAIVSKVIVPPEPKETLQ